MTKKFIENKILKNARRSCSSFAWIIIFIIIFVCNYLMTSFELSSGTQEVSTFSMIILSISFLGALLFYLDLVIYHRIFVRCFRIRAKIEEEKIISKMMMKIVTLSRIGNIALYIAIPFLAIFLISFFTSLSVFAGGSELMLLLTNLFFKIGFYGFEITFGVFSVTGLIVLFYLIKISRLEG